jgi:hypothetical protein
MVGNARRVLEDSDPVSRGDERVIQGTSGQPTKAFLVTYTVTNEIDGVIYAESAADARERFKMGAYDESLFEANGVDGRTGGVRVKRFPMEDR